MLIYTRLSYKCKREPFAINRKLNTRHWRAGKLHLLSVVLNKYQIIYWGLCSLRYFSMWVRRKTFQQKFRRLMDRRRDLCFAKEEPVVSAFISTEYSIVLSISLMSAYMYDHVYVGIMVTVLRQDKKRM